MIIGLCGFIGSGKGTVADTLVNDYGFNKLSFADTLKDAVSAIFLWPREMLEGDTKESREFREKPDPYWTEKFGYNVTPRYMLQLMGTEAGRNIFHKNLWIYSVQRKMDPEKNYVVSDVRFQNEGEFVRDSNKGFMVRIKRGEDPDWYDTAYQQNLGMHKGENVMQKRFPEVHASEWSWVGSFPIHYYIHNDGTIDQLKADIDHMLKVFTGPA